MMNARHCLYKAWTDEMAGSTSTEFLRSAKKVEDWSNVVFIGETWLNANHCWSKASTDDIAGSTSAVLIGKGDKVEMNSEVFETWFKDLILSLEDPSVIFIDNAPYQLAKSTRCQRRPIE